jgi:small-conductance mechanosensitive channel
MPVWDKVIFQNSVEKWLTALAVLAAVWLLLILLRRISYRRLLAFSRRTATPADDMLARLVRQTKPFFILAIAFYLGSLGLTLSPAAHALVGKLAGAAFLIQAGIWAMDIISFWLDRKKDRKPEEDAAATTTLGVLKFIARIGVWAAVLLLALDNFGIEITTLLAGLGVGGVAVALALQNVLGDLFASLSIILDKPFLVGDFIVVDGYLGGVEHIGLKTTRIRSLSGEQLVFGNGDLLKSRIRNYKRMNERRIAFSIGVTYQTTPEKLEAIPAIIKEIIEAQPDTRFGRAHFKAYGDFSLDFEIVYWVATPDYQTYMDTQQAINLALFRRFAAEGIEFAYPTRTIFIAAGATEKASPRPSS